MNETVTIYENDTTFRAVLDFKNCIKQGNPSRYKDVLVIAKSLMNGMKIVTIAYVEPDIWNPDFDVWRFYDACYSDFKVIMWADLPKVK